MSVLTSIQPGLGQPQASSTTRDQSKKSVLTLFGTRPELIKLAPVLLRLESEAQSIRTLNVSSGQHAELLDPLVAQFGIRIDLDLHLMTTDQDPARFLGRVLQAAIPFMVREKPDL